MKYSLSDKIMLKIHRGLFVVAVVILVIIGTGVGTKGWNRYRELKTNAGIGEVHYELRDDDSAICGKLKVYDFDIEGKVSDNGVIAFFLIHSNCAVYLDDKLVYEVKASTDALIGNTTGSYYAYVPLTRENAGSHIKVVVEPIYKSSISHNVEFKLDVSSNLINNHFRDEFWQVVLSLISIISGICFFVISFVAVGKNREVDYIGHLSLFSILIGVWKLMDVRMMPELLDMDPKLVSYISLTMLLFLIPPFVFFAKKQIKTKLNKLMDIGFCFGVFTAFVTIVLQILNVADYRQMLFLTHLSVGFAIIIVSFTVFYESLKRRTDIRVKATFAGFLVCISGAIADFIPFYMKGEPTDIPYTLLAFIIFTFINGAVSTWETNRKAITDLNTGLFNRGRCTEVLSDSKVLYENDAVAVLMLDLNYLKRVNDNYGHDQGDKLILAFSNIINSKLPAGSFAGRYGGDEFLAILYGTTGVEVQETLSSIHDAVEQYNTKKDRVPISYSEGSATSFEMPGKTIKELFNAADEKMYIYKREYHSKNDTTAYMKK